MTVTSGFFDSVGGDRKYNAAQMSALFEGILTDGIFMSVGTCFVVTANTGMSVLAGAGRGWFDKTWINNDSNILLTIEQAEVVLTRIDSIIIEIDKTESIRANSIKVLKGTPSSTPVPPTLTNTSYKKQYRIANITVDINVTEIAANKITNLVGTASAPFITGILESIDTAILYAQLQADFNAWFELVQGQLGEDPAGNLQNQINDIVADIVDLQTQINNIQVVPRSAMLRIPNIDTLPSGYLLMTPTAVNRTTYADLFTMLNTKYGAGDGSTTFNLPVRFNELYGPTAVSTLPSARGGFTITKLSDGRIVMIGGMITVGSLAGTTNVWIGTVTGNTISWVVSTPLPEARCYHSTIVLSDGRLLVTGGLNTTAKDTTYFGTVSGNGITWVSGTVLPAVTSVHGCILLPDNRILVLTGYNGSAATATTWFGTISGTTISWATGTVHPSARYGFAYSLLPDGRIVTIGGSLPAASNAIYFGSISGNVITWTLSASVLPEAKFGCSGQLLYDGRIIVVTGQAGSVTLTRHVGIIIANTITWTALISLTTGRAYSAICELNDRRIVEAGGAGASSVLDDCYISTVDLSIIKI